MHDQDVALDETDEAAAFLRLCHLDPAQVVALRITDAPNGYPSKQPVVYLTVWADTDLSHMEFPPGYQFAIYRRKRHAKPAACMKPKFRITI